LNALTLAAEQLKLSPFRTRGKDALHHDIALISTMAASLVYALVGGYVASRLRLPPLLGYLLAGVAVGPFTPGFVADAKLAPQLAEIGVILLMFGVGMHFSIRDLLAVRKIAIPGALVQIAFAAALTCVVTHFWGWLFGPSLVLGLALSVASTVVLLRALEAEGILESPSGQIAVGWLIVEDLVTVLILVMLPALATSLGGETGGIDHSAQANDVTQIYVALGIVLCKFIGFVLLMLVVGSRLLPWLLQQVAATGSRELFTLAVIAVAIGIGFGAAELFGLSFALGAFFAGVVVGESDHSHRAAEEMRPLQDAFTALFFVAMGMLFDPQILVKQPFQVLAVLAIIVLGKSAIAFLVVVLLGRPIGSALVVAASLAQIGEFSFILAELGIGLHLLPAEGQSLIVAGALLSIALNSFLLRAVGAIRRRIEPASVAG
jgi:CPA2 family monovalent cation:H+ antiporter-2